MYKEEKHGNLSGCMTMPVAWVSCLTHCRWEDDNNYCTLVKQQPLHRKGRRLLDIMDTAVFDFLIGLKHCLSATCFCLYQSLCLAG